MELFFYLVLLLICIAEFEVFCDRSIDSSLHHNNHHSNSGHKKIHRLKPSLSVIDAQHNQSYGHLLPAFAVDFSELFASAIIELPSVAGGDLHLSMLLVGHRSISHDYPFETISTEESVWYQWNKAVQYWSQKRKRKFQGNLSGLNCVMNNNIDGNSTTYSVPAMWVATTGLEANFQDNFEVLRCRLRGLKATPEQLQKLANSKNHLFVDIVRTHANAQAATPLQADTRGISTSNRSTTVKENPAQQQLSMKTKVTSAKASQSKSGSRSSAASSRRLVSGKSASGAAAGRQIASTSVVEKATDVSSPVIISFSVPWESRQEGYGFHFTAQSSHQSPWKNNMFRGSSSSSSSPSRSSSGNFPGGGISVAAKEHIRGRNGKASTVHVCVPGVRIKPDRLKTEREGVRASGQHDDNSNGASLVAVVQFVEYHLSLGIDHVFLGMAMDWKSVHMERYLRTLHPYILSNEVSVTSTSLPGRDGVMGVLGMHFLDEYADLFFLNQCLLYAKGVADFVLVLKPEQFLVSLSPVARMVGGISSSKSSRSSLKAHDTPRQLRIQSKEKEDIQRMWALLPSSDRKLASTTPAQRDDTIRNIIIRVWDWFEGNQAASIRKSKNPRSHSSNSSNSSKSNITSDINLGGSQSHSTNNDVTRGGSESASTNSSNPSRPMDPELELSLTKGHNVLFGTLNDDTSYRIESLAWVSADSRGSFPTDKQWLQDWLKQQRSMKLFALRPVGASSQDVLLVSTRQTCLISQNHHAPCHHGFQKNVASGTVGVGNGTSVTSPKNSLSRNRPAEALAALGEDYAVITLQASSSQALSDRVQLSRGNTSVFGSTAVDCARKSRFLQRFNEILEGKDLFVSLSRHSLGSLANISRINNEVLFAADSSSFLPNGPETLTKPHWIRCDGDHLSEVLKEVFQ